MESRRRFSVMDSSVIVSYILLSDPNHKKAIKFFDSFDKDIYIILPPLCIFEVSVTLAKYGLSPEEVENKVGDLLKSLNIIVAQLNDLQFFKNIDLISKGKNIGTHDFYILQTAVQFDIPIYTFDKKFVEHSIDLYKNIILVE